MKELEKAQDLIQVLGVDKAMRVCDILYNELSDLPRIPYNERRTQYWQNVKMEIVKSTQILKS